MADGGHSTRLGFCHDPLDRCDEIRGDPERLAACFADPNARSILLDGLDPLIQGDRLARELVHAGVSVEDHVLLGRDRTGQWLFVELKRGLPSAAIVAPRVWEASAILSPEEFSLYGAARSLVDWHARHGFCAVCGSATRPVRAGWSRRCEGCNAEHFPRVDPVVIMLAEHAGRVLVGRQARFPPRRYSALAGFVEPGETIEGAVARELFEEAGIRATGVRYVMSQPWPFPSSLMIACIAKADSDVLCLDQREIEDAFWTDAQGVRAALAGEESAPFIAPPPMAVAHHLLRHWADRQG